MKKVMARMVGFAALALALLSSAVAQNTPEIRVDIPFSFQVEGQHFSPGGYRLLALGDRHMVLQNARGTSLMLLPVHRLYPNKVNQRNVLVFKVYGGSSRFLSQIFISGDDFAAEMAVSRAEKEVAKKHLDQTYAMVGLKPKA
jgi:hypothetical protein